MAEQTHLNSLFVQRTSPGGLMSRGSEVCSCNLDLLRLIGPGKDDGGSYVFRSR
jgi:hypothetical protein